MSLRSALYAVARALGWFDAARRGTLPERYVRARLIAATSSAINRLIRSR